MKRYYVQAANDGIYMRFTIEVESLEELGTFVENHLGYRDKSSKIEILAVEEIEQ